MNKKKIMIILMIALVLIVVIFIIIFSSKINNKNSSPATKIFTPDFLTVEEKTKLDIPTDKKIQAIVRDESGAVTVYKVIKNNSDIITDLNQVNSASPSRVSTTTEVNN